MTRPSAAFAAVGTAAVLALGAVALWNVVTSAPALRAPTSAALTAHPFDRYDPGRVAFLESRRAYVDADAAATVSGFDTAAALARDSAGHRPRYAYAWTQLALAERRRGDEAAARAAFARSFALAPHGHDAAFARLTGLVDLWPNLDTAERRMLLSDVATLETHHWWRAAERAELEQKQPLVARLRWIHQRAPAPR